MTTTEKEFYAKVSKIEAKTLFNDENIILPKKSAYAIKVELPQGNKIVNFCSKSYGLVHNREIFPKIEELLLKHFIFEKKYKHVNHSVFWADYILETDTFSIGKKDDKVKPVIRIIHSYDGSVTFRAKMGYYRQICSNGLWGYEYDTDINYRHSVGNLPKIFEKTIEGVYRFIEEADENTTIFKTLAKQEVTDAERLIDLLVNSTQFPQRQTQAVIERAYQEQKTHNLEMSKWLIYNAFNYQLNHNDNFTNDELYRMKIDKNILQLIEKGVEKENKLVLV